jgi:plasmid stabilization system protein ParE
MGQSKRAHSQQKEDEVEMKYKIFVSDEAQVEIEKAYDWYEEQQDGLGRRFILHLEEAYDLILDFPYGFSARKKQYRECFLGAFPFVIIYRIVNNSIIIHRVFHTSRNPKKKKHSRIK